MAKDTKQALSDMSKVLQMEIKPKQVVKNLGNTFGVFSKDIMRRHGWHLLGITSTWFLLDIAY